MGRYIPRLSMRIFLIVFGLFISSYAYSNTALDAENEGEAIGIVYGHIKEIDVLKFMCQRKAPETGVIVSEAVDAWMSRNSTVITNLMNGLDRIPAKEREQLFEFAKTVSNNRIILFNKQSQPEKEELCLVLANKLDSGLYKEEYPIAYSL
jgi:dynactin complex subunit